MLNVQLPPASSLERTEGVVSRSKKSLKDTEGVVACTGVGGLGILTNSFSPEFASFFCKLEPWEERNTPELHVTGDPADVAAHAGRHSGAVDLPLRPAPDSRFRRGGRVQLAAAGPQRHADRGGAGQAGPGLHRGGAAAARAGQPVHVVQPAGAPGGRRAGPREGAQPGRADQRRLRGPVGLDGRHLRERLQPVRPTVPGLRPGRAGVPQRPDDIGNSTCGAEGDDGAAVHTGDREARSRAPRTPSASTCTAPSRSRAGPRRATARDRRSTPWRRWPTEVLPRGNGLRILRAIYQEKQAATAGPTFVLALLFVFLLLAALYESWKLPLACCSVRRSWRSAPSSGCGSRLREQRLRADRPGDAHRPRCQERHPHRGVRQDRKRGREIRVEAALERPGCASARFS